MAEKSAKGVNLYIEHLNEAYDKENKDFADITRYMVKAFFNVDPKSREELMKFFELKNQELKQLKPELGEGLSNIVKSLDFISKSQKQGEI